MPESSGYPKKSHSSDGKNQTKSCIAELCCGCALTHECVEDRLQMPHKILQCGRDCARPSVQMLLFASVLLRVEHHMTTSPKSCKPKEQRRSIRKCCPTPVHWTEPGGSPTTRKPTGHTPQTISRRTCYCPRGTGHNAGCVGLRREWRDLVASLRVQIKAVTNTSVWYLLVLSMGDQCLFYGVQMP